ncbi:MAG: ABC transporter ATP-binding protein [Candidatus Aminicenantaceae bacterium]
MKSGNSAIINARNLWKTYLMGQQEVNALSGVDLKVQKNEFMAIMGPSGSGKSTLMNLLGCLDTPSRGDYYLNQRLVSSMDDNDLAFIRNQEIGFVFQVFNLLSRATAFHNVELPLIYRGEKKRRREEKVNEALKLVEIYQRRGHLPSELSGGERQRVAIARALVNSPSLLLADEPTGNLDSKTGNEILNLFHKIHRDGNTIIMVTHDPGIARQAQRIIHIKDGKVEKEEKREG